MQCVMRAVTPSVTLLPLLNVNVAAGVWSQLLKCHEKPPSIYKMQGNAWPRWDSLALTQEPILTLGLSGLGFDPLGLACPCPLIFRPPGLKS